MMQDKFRTMLYSTVQFTRRQVRTISSFQEQVSERDKKETFQPTQRSKQIMGTV